MLLNEFNKDPHWTKEKIKSMAKNLNLTPSQVYKWRWDKYELREKKKTKID